MIEHMHKHAISAIVGASAILAASADLWAQAATKPGPPPTSPGYVGYIIAVIMVAGVCVAAFKQSNRGHQD